MIRNIKWRNLQKYFHSKTSFILHEIMLNFEKIHDFLKPKLHFSLIFHYMHRTIQLHKIRTSLELLVLKDIQNKTSFAYVSGVSRKISCKSNVSQSKNMHNCSYFGCPSQICQILNSTSTEKFTAVLKKIFCVYILSL